MRENTTQEDDATYDQYIYMIKLGHVERKEMTMNICVYLNISASSSYAATSMDFKFDKGKVMIVNQDDMKSFAILGIERRNLCSNSSDLCYSDFTLNFMKFYCAKGISSGNNSFCVTIFLDITIRLFHRIFFHQMMRV